MRTHAGKIMNLVGDKMVGGSEEMGSVVHKGSLHVEKESQVARTALQPLQRSDI